MSIVRCDGAGCANQIDTDQDTECLVPDPRYSLADYPDHHLCPKCRDRLDAEHDQASDHPTTQELEALGCGGMK